MSEWCSILSVCKHIHLLYWFISRWTIRLFPCLGYCKFCCINTEVHESFQGIVSSRYMLRTGIVGSYGNSVFTFFEELPYCFPQWLHQFTLPNSVRGFPSSPHPLQNLLFIYCLMMAILISMRWYLLAVSICLSLLISNAEHVFISLLAICVSSFKPQISIVRVTSMDLV